MNQASIWQVLFIGLCLVIVAYAFSRMARERHTAKLQAAAPKEAEHLAVMRSQRDEARLRQVEFEAHAEYAGALASMYRTRADRLDEDLEGHGVTVVIGPVDCSEDFLTKWQESEKTPA